MEIIHIQNSGTFAKNLGSQLGLSVFSDNVKKFLCGEISVTSPKKFYEVIVVASTVTNDDWIELFLLLDALRDSHKIILCMPYMGYARQDKNYPNEARSSKVFSRFIDVFDNVSKCVLVDYHSEPSLRIPTIHVSATKIFAEEISKKYKAKEIAIISPDIGGAYRAEETAKILGLSPIICSKKRSLFGKPISVDVTGDVKNKICILIDDIVDSGETLCHASEALLNCGCKEVVAYSSHGVLSEGAIERLEKSRLSEIVLSDSIRIENELTAKFKRISIVSLIAETIRCIL